eukprot:GFUD01081080.1.p1 GENE.GFUD01081080.1~~GFUD01081080.1.p1  ORF type:complete len:209 (+),score=29.12 GFUD01081080.1:2-628(+)
MDAAALTSFLECPVCFQVPRGKIFLCKNSHKICDACYIKINETVKKCPQGKCQYDQPPQRNRELEAIAESIDLELSCSSAYAGCTVELNKEELINHELSCVFRKVPCPDTSCEQFLLFKDVMSHLSANHKETIYLISPKLVVYLKNMDDYPENENWSLSVWTEDGIDFYPQILKRGPFWYFWIKALADPQTTSHYKVTAKIQNIVSKF